MRRRETNEKWKCRRDDELIYSKKQTYCVLSWSLCSAALHVCTLVFVCKLVLIIRLPLLKKMSKERLSLALMHLCTVYTIYEVDSAL